MPDAIITSTASTFGTISGTFAADQSTITGTITGIVPGTLSGSVGVPGPQGPAGPGSTWGGIAGTISAQTDLWTELGTKYLASNPAGYQTAGQVSTALAPYITSATASASFYPLTGNPSAFLQAAALTPYLLSSTASATYQTLAGMSSYLTTSAAAAGYYPLSGNPSGFLTAASLSGYATESWVTGQGYITSAALSPYLLSSTAATTYYPLTGNPSGFLTSSSLTPYLTKADNLGSLTNFATARDNLGLGSLSSPTFAGITAQGSGANVANLTPTSLSLTHTTLGSFVISPSSGITFPDSSVQTTAFTTSQLTAYLAKASNLSDLASTSTARTNLGLGSLAVVNDAPSDGSQYARKNGAWDVVTATSSYITSVSSPLSVTSGNLTIDLSAYAPLASPAFTGNPTAPTATFGDNDTSIATTAFVQAGLLGGTAVARNLEVEVRNQSGSTIAAGSIVYISGATGNKPLITKAQANNDANSAQTIGFVKTAIANNGTGYVIVRGELENIDTSALTEGVQLYLSPTTAGTWTTTKPSAPQHLVYVGIVIRSHPTQGTILVSVQNGYELGEIHDVALSGLANNDLLAYESSTDLWKNKTYSALGLLTSATAASTYQTLSGMSDYLTTATASSTYYPLTNPDNYLTNYNASFLFYPLSSNPAGYLTSAPVTSVAGRTGAITLANTDISGLGTMATATAADYSTTAAANALYYPLSSNPAGYLTSAPVTSVAGRTGAVTLAVADVSGAAPLASPTFSGTPSLPTGTIGVTQTAGNNTTALATTAFVQQEVPAASTTAAGKVELATLAEIITGTDTGRVMPVSQIPVTTASPYLRSLTAANATSVSGSGAVTANSGTTHGAREAYLTSTSVGRSSFSLGLAGLANSMPSWSTANFGQINFSNKIVMSGTTTFGITGYAGNANTCIYVTLGGYTTNTVGAMTQKGIGIKKVGGTSNVIELIVHNGTSQTAVSSSTAPALAEAVNWTIYSDGTGNVTLYINGTQAATTSSGPTGSNTAGYSAYREQVECPSGTGATHSIHSAGGWVYIRP